MVKQFCQSVVLLIFSSWAFSWTFAQEVELSVDQTELARGETLTLTIRVHNQQRQGAQLDLTSLTDEFEILATRTSSQVRSINGVAQSWTDYIITLFPLLEGTLTIPAMEIGDQSTDPIQIVVNNEGPRSNQNDDDDLFLELLINKDSVYVQEQLLFTIRLFYTINGIRNPWFTELDLPDTVIQLIGSPNQYEQLIDGERYGVYEKRYVVFPQRSGVLEFPDILFRGEVTDGSSNFVFRNLNTRRVTAFIDGIDIEVKERPAEARNLEYWLPASNLTIEESFNRDFNDLKIGDAITRTLTLRVEGLDGAILPSVNPPDIDGANLYPNPPDIDRSFVDGSIVGTRIESLTMVPVEEGVLEIPELVVPWWNTNTEALVATVVPATRVQIDSIGGAVPAEQSVASSGDLDELLARPPVVDQDMIDAQAEAEFIEVSSNWLLYSIMAALIIVMVSLWRLVLMPNRARLSNWYMGNKARINEYYSAEQNERVAFKHLARACRSRNDKEIRHALINWCKHYLTTVSVVSIEDILQQTEDNSLHSPVSVIQARLFNKDDNPEAIDYGNFLTQLKNLRKNKKRIQRENLHKQRFALPPLYRS